MSTQEKSPGTAPEESAAPKPRVGMSAAKLLGTLVQALVAPLVALVVAALVTSLVLSFSGASPSEFWDVMLTAPSPRNWTNIVNQTSMIFLAGLAAAIGFRMNLFNIGIEGQYTIAAYAAAVVAGQAFFPGKINILVALVVAMLVGALWAGIAGLLKVTRGVSEVIATIMLNSIALTLVGYLLTNYGQAYGQGRRTTPLEADSQFLGFNMFGERAGNVWTLCILALLAGILMSVLINWTRFGFDLRATGQNEAAAVASGVDVKKMVLVSMLLSGAVAGLIWMPSLFGGANYYGPTFQSGLGFVGLAVALLGQNRPLGIFFGAVLFAWLNEQANPLGLLAGISPSIVQITQGVAVLAVVVAYEFVRRWRLRMEQRALTRVLAVTPQTPVTEEASA